MLTIFDVACFENARTRYSFCHGDTVTSDQDDILDPEPER
jgi:hypothetical protein